jgi:hypothetical protein
MSSPKMLTVRATVVLVSGREIPTNLSLPSITTALRAMESGEGAFMCHDGDHVWQLRIAAIAGIRIAAADWDKFLANGGKEALGS